MPQHDDKRQLDTATVTVCYGCMYLGHCIYMTFSKQVRWRIAEFNTSYTIINKIFANYHELARQLKDLGHGYYEITAP